MCSLSRCLHELTNRQPADEFHQTVSLSSLHTLLTIQPDGSDSTAQRRPDAGRQPVILVDLGDSLRWICGPRTGWLSGCDWRGLRLHLTSRVRDFQASLFQPALLLPGDGGGDSGELDKLDWAAEQRERKRRVAMIVQYLQELPNKPPDPRQLHWSRPGFFMWLPPPGLVTAMRFCARRLEVPCYQSLDSRLFECVRLAAALDCRAIASDSPLCWLLQPPGRNLLLLHTLGPFGGKAFHGYQMLQMRQALLPRLCRLLGLQPDRLPMLVCLLGNQFLPAACLQRLHLAILPDTSGEPAKARLRSVAMAVAKAVREFSSADAVDEAVKLLEPHAASDEERARLRQQVTACLDYYRPCCCPASQQPPATSTPDEVNGHRFDSWLVQRARELHLTGKLHPWVAQVLHRRAVRVELGFEDPPEPEALQLDNRLELTVDLYSDIRARTYVLLYDIRCSAADIYCSPAAVRETVCRQDRGLSTSAVNMATDRFDKGLSQLDLPTCAELWGRVGQAGDGVRTTAFLACMHGWRLADPLCAQPLLDQLAVPAGLFLPVCVLRYLLLPPPRKPTLQLFEVHALVATLLAGADVDSPDSASADNNSVAAELIAETAQPPPSLRGLQLASLFAAGLDTAVFVSDACGRVQPDIVDSVAAGFLAFDGRRFQRLLRLADRGRAPLLLLCDGCPARLDALERIVDAVFKSLGPVGGPSFQKPRLCQPSRPSTGMPAAMPGQPQQPLQQPLPGQGRGRGLRPLSQDKQPPQPQAPVRCYPPGQLRVAGVPVSCWEASRLPIAPKPTADARISSGPQQQRLLVPSGAESNWSSSGPRARRQQRPKSGFRPLRLSDLGPQKKQEAKPEPPQPPPPAGLKKPPLRDERLQRLQQLLPGPPETPEEIEEKFIKTVGRGLVIG